MPSDEENAMDRVATPIGGMSPQRSMELLSRPLAIEERSFHSTMDVVRTLDIGSFVTPQADREGDAKAQDDSPPMTTEERAGQLWENVDGVGVLHIDGPMSKHEHSLMDLVGGTSTVLTRRAIRQMVADPNVEGIVIRIESPGGEVSGTADLASDVRMAAEEKKVVGYAEDLAASAAYWILSQTDVAIVNRHGQVGSIGTFAKVVDESRAWEQHKLRAIVVKAGEHKGDFEPGTEVTEEQVAALQREIDELNEVFLEDVAEGRKISREDVENIADGTTYVGIRAVDIGLVDRVGTFEEALSEAKMEDDGMPSNTQSGKRVDERVTAIKQSDPDAFEHIKQEGAESVDLDAKYQEGYQAGQQAESSKLTALKEAYGDEPKFVLEQYAKGADVASAAKPYADLKNKQIRDLEARAEDLDDGTTPASSRAGSEESSYRSDVRAAEDDDDDENMQNDDEDRPARRRNQDDEDDEDTRNQDDNDNEDEDSRKARRKAEKEWAANKGGVKDRFSSKSRYVAIRQRELMGAHRTMSRS